jgi:hypothetical protein
MLRDLRTSQKTLDKVQKTLTTALHTVETERRDFENQQLSWRSGIEHLVEEISASMVSDQDRRILRDLINSVTGEPQQQSAGEVADRRPPSAARTHMSEQALRTTLALLPPHDWMVLEGTK